MAITGVDGLDLSSDLRRMLLLVLNLTINIKEFNKFLGYACISGRLMELIVSYSMRSAVPPFCVLMMREDAVNTQACGVVCFALIWCSTVHGKMDGLSFASG